MRRVVISLVFGIALTVGLPTVAALALYGNSDAIVPLLLYWPLSVTDKLGFGNCANADLIADKLTCMGTALLIDAIFYPLAVFVCSYAFHRVAFRRGGRLRPSHVG